MEVHGEPITKQMATNGSESTPNIGFEWGDPVVDGGKDQRYFKELGEHRLLLH